MKEIKYRQLAHNADCKQRFHYWGFIDGEFIGPVTGNDSMANIQANSKLWSGFRDMNSVEVYASDIIECREMWISKKDESVIEENMCRLLVFYRAYRWELFGVVLGQDGEKVNMISLYLSDYQDFSWGSGIQDWKRDFEAKTRWLDFQVIGNESENPELLGNP